MYYIIETREQMDQFRTYDLSESFIEPILFSDTVHPLISPVCGYIIKPNRSRTPFFLSINHSEGFSLAQEDIMALFNDKVTRIWTSDAKKNKCHLPANKPVMCLTAGQG
jgi:hypothetical protein